MESSSADFRICRIRKQIYPKRFRIEELCTSGSPPPVGSVMHAYEQQERLHPCRVRWFGNSPDRLCDPFERVVDSIRAAIRDIVSDQTAQISFVQNECVVEELSTEICYPTLGHSILPGERGADPFRYNRAGAQEIGDILTKFAITIHNHSAYICQVSRHGFELILVQNEPKAGKGRVFISIDDEQEKSLRSDIREKGIEASDSLWGMPIIEILDRDRNELFFSPPERT
jgi:hypothetical protein